MATTAQDIIRGALEELGVYAPGDTLGDDDAQRGLAVLNDMLDSWSNENLMTFATVEQSGTLTVGKSAYTIGTAGGADFAVTRPLRLITGPVSAYSQDTNGNNYFIEVVERAKWNQIGNRSATVTSNFPDTLFYDSTFPLGTLNFFPTPNITLTVFWDSYLQLVELSNLTTAIALPPGYAAALRHNLAVEIQPFFSDGPLSQTILTLAMVSKGNVKRTNIKPVEAIYDSEIVSRAAPTYNIYSDRRSGSGTI